MTPESNDSDATVDELIEDYLAHQESAGAADQTVSAHRSRLKLFKRWFKEETDMRDVSELAPKDFHEFQVWRRKGIRKDGVSDHTVRSSMLTVRKWIRWCGQMEAIDSELHESILIPSAEHSAREEILDADRAEELLEYLDTYYHASAQHVIIRVLWRTGMRAGALNALDIPDFKPGEQTLTLRHRPDEGTPLKNGNAGERVVAIDKKTTRLLEDWIEFERPEYVDEHGREALIPARTGRRSTKNLRKLVYNWTRPCHYKQCPEARDPDECDAASWRGAHQCPHTVSTHPIRRGSITNMVRSEVPQQVVSDRVNCSVDTLKAHYLKMSLDAQAEIRRGYLDNI